MKRDALISPDGKYRYWLTRRWREDGFGGEVLWVMLNPSTADAAIDDPTVLRCIKFSQAWGFDGLTIANLYAYRSSDPSALWGLGVMEAHGADNDKHLWHLSNAADAIVLAWGNPGGIHIPLTLAGKSWWCLGKTKSGAPKHPLARGTHRVPDGAPMLAY